MACVNPWPVQGPYQPFVMVFGHSFVRRLRSHVVPLGKSKQNLDLVSTDVLYCIGGLCLSGEAYEESKVATGVGADAIVVDLGSNDLDCVQEPDPAELARTMFQFCPRCSQSRRLLS